MATKLTEKALSNIKPIRKDFPHQGPSTRSVHINRQNNPYHSVTEPIVQAATYHFANTVDLCAFMEANINGKNTGREEYGRYGNSTVSAVEKRLAGLENAEDAVLFSSGMAAITTVLLTLLPTGSNVIITDDCYRRTRQFCNSFLQRLGISCTVVPVGNYELLESSIQPNTKLLVSESPTNPYLRIIDMERFTEIARGKNIKTILDATFSTPLNLRPLDWGIDLVIHSATKYLGGHNDIMAGVVAGSSELIKELRESLGILGAITDPHNAYLLLRGIKTLGLRVAQHNRSGQAVSQFLEGHPKIERVWYPGLQSHPDHTTAIKQMTGFGGVVSFTIKGDLETTSRFIDAVNIPLIGPSFGGAESLIEQPALQSFYEFSAEERQSIGITDNLIRLALGIEDTEDLIIDLQQALDQV